jgi:tRNA modification GTPase
MFDDTIAAIATPLGEGGLAVIRVSGAKAFAIADACFRPSRRKAGKPSEVPSHTLHHGHVVRDGQNVDEVLLAVMRAPRTYTCEHTIEISCHGGLLPAKAVLDTMLAAGARLALPGEFTKRAFINGRLDLAQAEAVADLIHARTELAMRAAGEQLAGKLSQRINQLRDDLIKTLAHIEAHIDFPDEDISPDTRGKLVERLANGLAFMDTLLRTANEGKLLRRGIRAAIIGRPNAGKSSLLNQLLGHDRAIVSHIPGTTRDTIEETANIRGVPVVFIDTAGLREAGDEIEIEGIRRSRETLGRAELILHVFDAGEPLTPEDEKFLQEFADKKRILVRNKTDLPVKLGLPVGTFNIQHSTSNVQGVRSAASLDVERSMLNVECSLGQEGDAVVVDVSCATGQGIEVLKDAIKELVWTGQVNAEMLEVMINSRHQDALNRARQATELTIAAIRSDLSLELVALDLHIAVNAVGEIVGKTTTEDLLDSIFSQFCLGK